MSKLQLVKNNFLAPDVDLPELAERTKNFTGELWAVVRCAACMPLARCKHQHLCIVLKHFATNARIVPVLQKALLVMTVLTHVVRMQVPSCKRLCDAPQTGH